MCNVARALLGAGQSQHIGQALLTTGAAGWLTLSPDKVTRSSLPVANKVIHWLMPVVRALMPTLILTLTVSAQPRIDNVLERMVPPSSTGLVGAHMDQIKQTEIYKKMVAAQSLVQLDQFALETGFDPRRDVRELLFVTTPQGAVMLARGNFHLHSATLKNVKKTRHGQYEIWGQGGSGFCLLDSTLAAAGEIPALELALDEWKSGAHTAARPLLANVAAVNPQFELWGISTGAGNFLAEHPPGANSGLDFSKIFSSLQDYWFEADFSAGMRSEVHGTTHTEKDAVSLRDTVRGIVGLGRLSVPDNQPDLLKVWDGITIDQQGRSIAIHADVTQDLIDRMVQMLSGASGSSAPDPVGRPSTGNPHPRNR